MNTENPEELHNVSCIALNAKRDINLNFFEAKNSEKQSSPFDSFQVYNEKKVCNAKHQLCSPILQARIKFDYDLFENYTTKKVVCSAKSLNPRVDLTVEKYLFITRRKNESTKI